MSRSGVGVYVLAAALYALLGVYASDAHAQSHYSFFDERRPLALDLERIAVGPTDQGDPIPALPHLWLLTTDSTGTDGCFSGDAVHARGTSLSSPYAAGVAEWEPQSTNAALCSNEGGQV